MSWFDPKAIVSAFGIQMLWLALAAGVHAAAFAALPSRPPMEPQTPVSDLAEIEVIEQEQEPEIDREDSETVEVDAPPNPRTPKPPPEPVEPTKEPPAAADEVPFSFENILLSNQGQATGDAWKIDTRPDAVVTGRNKRGQAGGVIGGEGTGLVTDLGDLSRQPKPPNLKRKLERNYPKKARAEGKEGIAQVRLQVNSDGSASRLRVVLEDPKAYGFGQACVRTLTGERWQPPVDDSGRRVATRVTYSCRFKVRY